MCVCVGGGGVKIFQFTGSSEEDGRTVNGGRANRITRRIGKLMRIARIARPGASYNASAYAQTFATAGGQS